jgi:hypothetical protein
MGTNMAHPNKSQAKASHAAKLASYRGESTGIANGKSFYGDDTLTSDVQTKDTQRIPTDTMARGGKINTRLDRAPRKSGGRITEGSAKDMREDRALAKKAGMSLKEWEKSPADEEHDEGEGMCSGGRAKRASGGRTGKGKTTVNIVIGSPAPGAAQPGPGAEPPPPAAVPIPVPPPPMAGPPGMPPGGAPMPPMRPPMMRASGGRVKKIELQKK